MAVLILLGVISLFQIKSELIPSFSLDRVQVRIAWGGASPEEVEEGACIKIEEAITGIEGIQKISSVAILTSIQSTHLTARNETFWVGKRRQFAAS